MGLQVARFDGDSNLEDLKDQGRQRKAKVRQRRGERKPRRTKSQDIGSTATTQKREKRKVRRALSQDGGDVVLADQNLQPEPEPEPGALPSVRVSTASLVFDSPSNLSDIGSENSEDEGRGRPLIDEVWLEAELHRDIRKTNHTMQDYTRNSDVPTSPQQNPKVLEMSQRERLEFLAGKGRAGQQATKRWWWLPMPTYQAEHISLAVHKRSTVPDRLLATYQKAQGDAAAAAAAAAAAVDGYSERRTGCLSAEARHAAAREAKELTRLDTIQYLTELKAACTEREEIQKKEANERHWGKLRKIAMKRRGGSRRGAIAPSTALS
jgi:hypothetical protein